MSNPFDFIKSINKHEYFLTDSLTETEYNPYVTNIAFSMFEDTLFLANEMNKHTHLPKKMQYDFYFYSVKPRNRYKPWSKKDKNFDDIKLIAEIYKYDFRKARDVLRVLTDEQLEDLRKNYNNKGG